MSEEAKTPEASPPPAKKSIGVLAILLPALIAGGAAFGGAKIAGAHTSATVEKAEPAPEKPPGPTVALDPFLVTVPDVNKKMHAMKLTMAVEFDHSAKEESLKSFIPRIRDATLTYLRSVPYEDALDAKTEKMRVDLLERIRATGASVADRVLITDLVVQ